MAKPRVFISSTYFDLKSVRADLEHFVREQGFDPVLHERGSVPYGNAEALERYCYKEIESCDTLVSLIGGRFGSMSIDSGYTSAQWSDDLVIFEVRKPGRPQPAAFDTDLDDDVPF